MARVQEIMYKKVLLGLVQFNVSNNALHEKFAPLLVESLGKTEINLHCCFTSDIVFPVSSPLAPAGRHIVILKVKMIVAIGSEIITDQTCFKRMH